MPAYDRTPMHVDSRTKDWPRKIADDLNSIERGYILTMFYPGTPVSDEILWTHPVGVDFAIPANWAPLITQGVAGYAAVKSEFDTNPAATFAIDVQRKPVGGAYASIGTWSISTGGVLTATTLNSKVIQVARGDVLKWLAPHVEDVTAATFSFTLHGFR